jgi:hypothetical protein
MLVLVHETLDRMRFTGAAIKEKPGLAASLVETTQSLPGVTSVMINPLTGSLIVYHRGTPLQRNIILDHLNVQTKIPIKIASVKTAKSDTAVRAFTINTVAEALVGAIMQRIVDRALHAVVAAII